MYRYNFLALLSRAVKHMQLLGKEVEQKSCWFLSHCQNEISGQKSTILGFSCLTSILFSHWFSHWFMGTLQASGRGCVVCTLSCERSRLVKKSEWFIQYFTKFRFVHSPAQGVDASHEVCSHPLECVKSIHYQRTPPPQVEEDSNLWLLYGLWCLRRTCKTRNDVWV